MNKPIGVPGKRILILIAAAFILAVFAMISGSVYFSDSEYRFRTARFNKLLAEKETVTEECLDRFRNIIAEGEDIGSVSGTDLFTILKEEGITLVEYVDDKLFYWSDNSFDIPVKYTDSLFTRPLVFIHNGWFITKSYRIGNERIIALLRLSNDFGFENDLVRNGFVSSFRLPEGTGISFTRDSSRFDVYNNKEEWIFSLDYPTVKNPSPFIILPAALWIAVLLMAIYISGRFSESLANGGRRVSAILSSLAASIIIYLIILIFRKPAVFFETDIFSGYRFSLNAFIPSLGHLLLLSILLLLPARAFARYFSMKMTGPGRSFRDWSILTLSLCAGALLLIAWHGVFNELIFDSNISFEPYRVLNLSVYSLAGFVSVFLLLLIPVFFISAILRNASESDTGIFYLSIILPALLTGLSGFSGIRNPVPVMLLFLALSVSGWHFLKAGTGRFSATVLFSLFFGLYSLYSILDLSESKNIENKKVLAVSYSSEHDPEAEHLLLDLWPALNADTVLAGILKRKEIAQDDIDNITAYLHDRYFYGYWGNFNMSIVTCSNDSPLWITSQETLVDNCFEFFRERVRRFGHQLTGTGFWFLDNQGGRSYYMGQLFYDLGENRTNGLFIELYSDIDAFQAGYSELLLDKKYQGYMKLKDFSFAKFINGNLVLRTGDFPYDKSDAHYIDREYDYRVFNSEKYKHVLYRNGNVTVIISEKRLSAVDVIISFAYLFASVFILSNILLVLLSRPDIRLFLKFNFRQKLQIAFITVLMFSFISVGIVVAFFSIRQFQNRHLENIQEKINSIYTELENKLSIEPELTAAWRDPLYPTLNELLISLSNIFNTDINIYDTRGYLMATSRPEVFYRDLTSRRINMDAFNNLEKLTKSEYIQSEKIASLEFVSAYVPFFNNDNKLLAYINLPYFRMQSVLARDISNVIVAVVNFTLLLIVVAMFIAVIISGRLTSSLRMLSEGIGSVELGKQSNHLTYSGHDEISDIVAQYNRMVDELQESARKLAISEREFAWREMAKQVAHEIKNPLTPMKLNIQQLYKSWKDGIPGFERKLENFTRNQIEYIETLSSIASAFSSFAKMPAANPVNINLADQIKTTLELFKNEENITFRTDWPVGCRIIVNADKEHLNGVFSNLIKNAIQSIPQGRTGVIKIKLELKGDKVTASVEDNGSGIPEELKKNMFTPNFTTKSSGTGLGLSIVKRFVETAGGRVWFDSQKDKGSVFFVELPVVYTVERLG